MSDPAGLAQLAVDATFDAFGYAANYFERDSGATADCTIVRASADQDLGLRGGATVSRPFTRANRFQLRASEVAKPISGAIVTFRDSGDSFEITSDPKTVDEERLVFEFTAKAATR